MDMKKFVESLNENEIRELKDILANKKTTCFHEEIKYGQKGYCGCGIFVDKRSKEDEIINPKEY